WQMKKTPKTVEAAETEKEEQSEKERKLWQNLVLLVIGAAAIAFGADLLVDNGTLIAEMLGVPESVIALTFVALGTSLPELITAITSLVKGYSSLSLGNIIGANLFNLVLVSGLSITLKPFDVPQSSVFLGHQASLVLDIPLMFAVMLILTVPALWKEKLYRWQGILLLALYAGFCAIQFAM
ncbi:MAG: sodium:calcium antiporter, partial [Ruminococcus sp.]|nr:sodium:calcium antiporter [Candidatus Apopatosoma intestinale]